MNKLARSIGIIGTGSYLPEKVLTNFDLEKMVDTSNEWILKRTGISERRILDKNEPNYSMGVKAAKNALENSNLKAEDIDLIVYATITADYHTPSAACIIQKEIGACNATTFDINAACTGFIYALVVAQQFILSGMYKNALVIGCEALSKITDWSDRNTCVLFGDGAGAAILGEVDEGFGILNSFLGSDGASGMCLNAPSLYITEEEKQKRKSDMLNSVWMDGTEVFKFAVRTMSSATVRVLEELNMTVADLQHIFPHQANTRIIDGAIKKLGITDDKLYYVIQKYGNISSASIPVALDEANREGRLKKGDNIVLVGFGGGLTWGSIVMKWF